MLHSRTVFSGKENSALLSQRAVSGSGTLQKTAAAGQDAVLLRKTALKNGLAPKSLLGSGVSVSTPTASGPLATRKQQLTGVGLRTRQAVLQEKSNTVKQPASGKATVLGKSGLVSTATKKTALGTTDAGSATRMVTTDATKSATKSVAPVMRVRALRDITNQTPGSAERSTAKNGKAIRFPKTTSKTALGKGLQVWADDYSLAHASPDRASNSAIQATRSQNATINPSNRRLVVSGSEVVDSEMPEIDHSNEEYTVEYMAPSTYSSSFRFSDELDVDVRAFGVAPSFEYITDETKDIITRSKQLDLSEPVPHIPRQTEEAPKYDGPLNITQLSYDFDSSLLII
ncbi:hypothetical protein BSLG_004196 [Batrachochytrium salamandrivorans]|nr:hypothetical protein BASA60_006374 [Batrachochytrium salamandrivorans]KAH9269888.1 hypothetical protein BASA83_008043 [Batrachochytrium salamandrivorans]KAJ1341191.1 hypothetical protein BSLG_004196 [Batrachochytrium salamandrivorans]